MPFTYQPPFPQVMKRKTVNVGAAACLPTAGAPTNTVDVGTAVGLMGGVVTRVSCMPNAVVPTGGIVVAMFITSTGTSVKRYVGNVLVPAGAPIAQKATAFVEFTEGTPFRVESGDTFSFGALTAFPAGIDVTIQWSDF